MKFVPVKSCCWICLLGRWDSRKYSQTFPWRLPIPVSGCHRQKKKREALCSPGPAQLWPLRCCSARHLLWVGNNTIVLKKCVACFEGTFHRGVIKGVKRPSFRRYRETCGAFLEDFIESRRVFQLRTLQWRFYPRGEGNRFNSRRIRTKFSPRHTASPVVSLWQWRHHRRLVRVNNKT